jgi:hypothetical protein
MKITPSTLRDLHVYLGLVVAWAGGAYLSIAWATVGLGLGVAALGFYMQIQAKGPTDAA